MAQEEKDLLLKDLCTRLPYKPKVHVEHDLFYDEREPYDTELNLSVLYNRCACTEIKPYLRPMSSMTDEEYAELRKMTITSPNLQTAVTLFWEHYYNEAPNWRNDWTYCSLPNVLDWLNARHFDYRGLIEKGLALEAPEDMYKTK